MMGAKARKVETLEEARVAILELQPLMGPHFLTVYLHSSSFDSAGPGKRSQEQSFRANLWIGPEFERDDKAAKTNIEATTPAELYASAKRWVELIAMANKKRHRTAPEKGPRRLTFQPVEPLFE